jgi:Zn-dependent metalloprotease
MIPSNICSQKFRRVLVSPSDSSPLLSVVLQYFIVSVCIVSTKMDIQSCYKGKENGEIESPSNYHLRGFIQPQILQNIADSHEAPGKTRNAAINTLNVAKSIHENRATVVPNAAVAATPGAGFRAVHDCKETTRLPGTLVRKEGASAVKDRSVNNVYDGFGIVLKFFSSVFNRNSIDDAGFDVVGSLHYDKNFNNAYWNSKQMVFGDGDGISFDSLANSLDVIAHELTHGVTEFTANFAYNNQSGALNESMSDVFACMVEQWHLDQTSGQGDWILGQTIWPVGRKGAALRSLKAPGTAYNDPILGKDTQPAHMRDYNTTKADNGGVHLNSGIPNHAFYLAATSLGGNSWDRAGQVWYKTLLDPRIKPDCSFKQFAELTVDNAHTMFGEAVKDAVRNAWVSVGVLT